MHLPAIVASVLPADPARLGAECVALAEAGVDGIQWDIMDGRFVPNLTFGPETVARCRELVNVPFEAHLMIHEPDAFVPHFVTAGCELVIVHAEACLHLQRTLSSIRDLGARAGVALNPHTPAAVLDCVLDVTDLVLVMTVNPGFGGQRYLPAVEAKTREVRRMVHASERQIDIEVDGGISAATIASAAGAGADVFVSGSYLFGHPDGMDAAVRELRALAGAAQEAAGRPHAAQAV